MLPRTLVTKVDRLKRYFRGWGPTWSQFGEDAYLQGYFRDKVWTSDGVTRPAEIGFYVDVGCFHPVTQSNTLGFYKKGWSGINIDATPGSKRIFDRWRPRDINLEVAVSTHTGHLAFYTDSGRSSVFNTTSPEQARKYQESGRIRKMERVQVPCRPLSAILEENLPAGRKISFLSVDAEGNDADVLRSNNWTRYRPELVLAETHASSLEELAADDLVALMRGNGYRVRSWIAPTLVFERADA